MIDRVRRIAAMTALEVARIGRSPRELILIVLAPVGLGYASTQFLGGGDAQAGVVVQTPNGLLTAEAWQHLRLIFAFYLLFAFAGLLRRAGALAREREAGTLQRTLLAGVPYGEIVCAHAAGIALIGLLQAAVVVAVTAALGAPWAEAGPMVVALSFGGAVCAASGLALALSGLVRSNGLVQFIAGGLPMLLAYVGGVFWPLSFAPGHLQQLARLDPLYWCMVTLTGGFLYNGVADQAWPLAALALIGVLGLVVGVQGLGRMRP